MIRVSRLKAWSACRFDQVRGLSASAYWLSSGAPPSSGWIYGPSCIINLRFRQGLPVHLNPGSWRNQEEGVFLLQIFDGGTADRICPASCRPSGGQVSAIAGLHHVRQTSRLASSGARTARTRLIPYCAASNDVQP